MKLRAYAILALLFLHAPLLILIAFSFNASRFTVWEGFSLHWYTEAFRDPQLAEGLINSLIIAALSAVLSTAIGTLAAYGMWRRSAPVLPGSLYLSLVTPEIVTGVSLLALFQWAFRFLHLQLGLYTVVIAHVAFSIAYVVIVISARLRSYDRTLEEAAMDLGASEWRAFRRVTLPLLYPAIAAAALLALVVSFDDYVITSLVAGVDSQTLPMVIYAMARRGVSPVVNAVSAMIVVVLGALILASGEAAEAMNRRTFLAAASSMGLAACSHDPRPRLNVFNWSTYIDPAMIAKFEAENRVRVRYATYESNEEMLAKVMTGNSGWDVVFPTHSRLAPMARNGLLTGIDHSRLPSLGNLDGNFQKPVWDPDLAWGVPYMWNATGIAYNRAQVAPAPAGWDTLWDPALRGRMTMLDDPEDAIGACLEKLRLPFGSTADSDLQKAKAAAVAQKKLLRAYLNAEVRDQLVSGDVLAAQLWSTTAAQAIHQSPRIGFVYPAEGFPLYCDCAAILRESSRRELAHEFLEFLLRPDVAAANARAGETATANGAARAMLPEDPVLYPPSDVQARGVWPTALPSAAQRYRDRLWTEIKAA